MGISSASDAVGAGPADGQTPGGQASGPWPPARHKRLARNVVVLAGSQVVTWALTLLWTVFVPRAIGASGLGKLTAALAFTGILGLILAGGLPTLLVKELAKGRARASRLVRDGIVLQLVGIPLACLAVAGYLRLGHFDHEQVVVTWLVAAAMIVGILARPLQSAFQGFEQMEYLALGEILRKTGQTVLGIALVLAGLGVISLAALGLAMGTIVLVLDVFWARRLLTIDLNLDPRSAYRMLVASFPYFAVEIFYTVYLWVDSVLLSLLVPATVVGWYGVPTRLIGALIVVPAILSTAWLPRLSATWGSPESKADARYAIELVTVLSLPIMAGTMIVARPVLGLLYGPEFLPATPVLVVLAMFIPPVYFNTMLWQVLVASNRQSVWSKVMAGATVANIVLNVTLIPATQARFGNGAIGAAISLVATEVLMAVVGLVVIADLASSLAFHRLLGALLATAGMSAAAVVVAEFGLAAQIVVGVVVFAALALLLRVTTVAEARRLRQMVVLRHQGGRA